MLSLSRAQPFDTETFPGSYREARERWLESLPDGAASDSHGVAGEAPSGGALATDVAWLGPADAAGVLVLIAGTHGVEGYAGSAVQNDLWRLYRAGRLALPDDVAIMAIHALNPWGYAWDRRCDGEGIDVNRNFVDFSRPLPANPGYDSIREVFAWADPRQRAERLAAFRREQGPTAFEIAVSGGQYCDPRGPFFGGRGDSHSRRVIEMLVDSRQLARRRLAVIDIHTGLGPYGYGEVICDHPPASGGARTARAWYGPSCTLPAEGTSSSVPKFGLLDYAWHRIMADDSCFITLEFGTLGTDRLFEVLLDENQGWARQPLAPPAESERLRLAALMRSHFYPDDDTWREAVLFRARQVITQALGGLAVAAR